MTFKVPFSSLSLDSVISGQWGGVTCCLQRLIHKVGLPAGSCSPGSRLPLCSSVVLRRDTGALIVSPDDFCRRKEKDLGKAEVEVSGRGASHLCSSPPVEVSSVPHQSPASVPTQRGAVEGHGVWSQRGPDSNPDSALQASGLRCEVSTLSASIS